jgi:hypothetical protein
MTDFVNSEWEFDASQWKVVEICYKRHWRKWWHALPPFRWIVAPAHYTVDYGFINMPCVCQ